LELEVEKKSQGCADPSLGSDRSFSRIKKSSTCPQQILQGEKQLTHLKRRQKHELKKIGNFRIGKNYENQKTNSRLNVSY